MKLFRKINIKAEYSVPVIVADVPLETGDGLGTFDKDRVDSIITVFPSRAGLVVGQANIRVRGAGSEFDIAANSQTGFLKATSAVFPLGEDFKNGRIDQYRLKIGDSVGAVDSTDPGNQVILTRYNATFVNIRGRDVKLPGNPLVNGLLKRIVG